MALSLDALLRLPELGLGLLAGVPEGSDVLAGPLHRAHSSDLIDPTPWLEAGGLLLTDGTQFARSGALPEAEAYVGRLRDVGVVALVFSVGCVHVEVPADVVAACQRHALPLLTITGPTPFLAVVRTVDDALAREQQERVRWSLEAQRALSRAALRPDGLHAVVTELERQLGCWVALYDAAGDRVPVPTRWPVPPALVEEVGRAVRAALSSSLPSSSAPGTGRVGHPGPALTVQTVGRRQRLRGAIAVGTAAPSDRAAHDLVGSVIALASVALEQSHALEEARRHLRAGVWELLLAGEHTKADRAARAGWGRLPPPPFRVVVTAAGRDRAALLAELEVYAERHPGRVFFTEDDGQVVVLTRHDDTDDLRQSLVRRALPAGSSTPVGWSDLGTALTQARRAYAATGDDQRYVRFEDLAGRGMLGLLEASGGQELATRLLAPLAALPSAERDLLTSSVSTWLLHRCTWDPAAKALGVHRHTLRNRVDVVADLLRLDLDGFAGRAELWAALQLVGTG